MKLIQKIILPFCLIISVLPAAIPSGYYDTASGLSGTNLRQELHDIIDNHTVLSYDDVWTAYQTTDVDSNGYIWDMYTGIEWTYLTDQQGYDGDMDVYTNYNREHSWPKSWANETSPHYTDLNHLYPVQAYANSHRNNLPYGEVASGQETYTSENGTLKGPARSGLGYVGTVFEPIDEYKGDLARTYFYMSTRYYGEDSAWDSVEMAIGCELQEWALNMLLDWDELDPVSQKEIDRNDAVYALQGNRNPFIDHPEYVDSIWVSTSTSIDAPTAQSATNISHDRFTANWSSVSGATGYKLYVSQYADFGSYISGYGPKDVGNVTSDTVISLSSSTTYYYRVRAYDASTESGNSNTINLTTLSTGTPVNGTVFFSEYIEGSSYNKALEIFNISGSAVDLSNITIKMYSNGSTTSNYSLTLSGTLNNRSVYVVAHGSASPAILAVADLTSNGVTNYNGNDAVELYYNDSLVDVLGEVGSSAYYAQDVTLVRKSNITEGNSIYTASEWDSYAQDETGYLGSHTVTEEALAISLTNFNAVWKNDHIHIEWSTASEIENSEFRLYRNDDLIASIEGAGTSTNMHSYEYEDYNIDNGGTYTYYIEDVDYSGAVISHKDFSVKIVVPESDKPATVGQVYPNPFNPITNLPLVLDQAGTVQINLYDLKGNFIGQLAKEHYSTGEHTISLNLSENPSGLYFVEFLMNDYSHIQKVLYAK
jgi:endonuclease I